MGYDRSKWRNRIKHRTDIGSFVFHLTKSELDAEGNTKMHSMDRLLKIISERKIKGSSTQSGFIIGKRKAVCFQDAPISGIAQNVVHEQDYREDLGGKVRYVGIGLAFPKLYIFQQGGRPVVYEQKEVAKNILPENEWWRIVNFDLSDEENIIDWSHEREWRLPVNEFYFDLSHAVVLLPNERMYKRFVEKLPAEDLTALKGVIQGGPLIY